MGNPVIDLPDGTVPAGLGGAKGKGTGVGQPGTPDLSEPRSLLSTPLVAIGDLHGNLREAKELWSHVEAQMGADVLNAADVVFLGDYCDRGPDTRGVLDWLVQLSRTRAEGKTHFIAGNHDLGFAAFIGHLPIDDPQNPPLDLDGTKKPAFTRGFWPHPVAGGMHYQGRRWGEGRTYDSFSTFSSYGVDLDGTAEMRAKLAAAVPDEHKDFLQRMLWLHEAERTWGRVVCVHAGLTCNEPLAPQLAALRARDLSAGCLFANGDSGRLAAMCERRGVEPMPPELAGRALLISGHHGFDRVEADRIIIDASGGRGRQQGGLYRRSYCRNGPFWAQTAHEPTRRGSAHPHRMRLRLLGRWPRAWQRQQRQRPKQGVCNDVDDPTGPESSNEWLTTRGTGRRGSWVGPTRRPVVVWSWTRFWLISRGLRDRPAPGSQVPGNSHGAHDREWGRNMTP